MDYLNLLGKKAKESAKELALAATQEKNKALQYISDALKENKQRIIEGNQKDVEEAVRNNTTKAMIDRLTLTEERIDAIANAVLKVKGLADPVGIVESGSVLLNGLQLTKRRVPLGVVGIIYEARPNVTVDAATLCLKSGNACILRGGKDAIHSNLVLVAVMQEALQKAGISRDAVILVEKTDRETAAEMMKMREYIDVLIPRGGAGLIQSVVQNATIPVIETGVGNCHAYVDEYADMEMAVSVVDNAKTNRPSVCNAIETLLVHKAAAKEFLPAVKQALDKHHVELVGCPETIAVLGDAVSMATDEDYAKEFSDYKLAVKVVDTIEDAIKHIQTFSSGHSEVILTDNIANANLFVNSIDSAALYVNASTRFTDGEEFGFGAEIGISTQKLHVRGPMGLKELTTNKYVLFGNGQIR